MSCFVIRSVDFVLSRKYARWFRWRMDLCPPGTTSQVCRYSYRTHPMSHACERKTPRTLGIPATACHVTAHFPASSYAPCRHVIHRFQTFFTVMLGEFVIIDQAVVTHELHSWGMQIARCELPEVWAPKIKQGGKRFGRGEGRRLFTWIRKRSQHVHHSNLFSGFRKHYRPFHKN